MGEKKGGVDWTQVSYRTYAGLAAVIEIMRSSGRIRKRHMREGVRVCRTGEGSGQHGMITLIEIEMAGKGRDEPGCWRGGMRRG